MLNMESMGVPLPQVIAQIQRVDDVVLTGIARAAFVGVAIIIIDGIILLTGET